ncbi:AfsR/SARP family transcriptional regulator [Streptomonospora sp. PA3]|uniref:AfsR/SARP family transcriptional regulator n=1 Tax=Streptomonospora sp. PA3 TaxID=2607326 RepID=UPI0012DE9A80|nr:BTAD domain-containing putative transcriptional regulator [Streptomonospora sp. PA3]MUL41462.1 AfsR/SARP family transcriptional regulator [Streptomonospora sp. PA3]
MRVGILGPTEVRSEEGTLLGVGGVRGRAVLAVLALDAGRPVPKERLIDGVYGQSPPAGADNALQSQISRLRGALRSGSVPGPVESHPAGYRLAIDPLDVDAHRFEDLAARGHEALAAEDHGRAVLLLDEALSQWRGPALVDVAAASFAEAAAQRLAELRLGAVESRIEARLALGEGGAPVGELFELVADHPLRERLRGLLMRALQAGGRQAEALAVFEQGRARLAEELGADPSPELARLHTAILRGEETAPPARPRERVSASQATGARPLRALPAQLTGFVPGGGPEQGPEGVRAKLRASRLVTLTGPGGVGKTRLALEAAALEPGEICFVELARTESGGDVPQAVLTALGIRESGLVSSPVPDGGPPRADPSARLAAALADRALLLVLDNCEHVLAAAAELAARLLEECPRLRILATSQETLRITGERVHPVAPLALPPENAGAEEAIGYPSVRLFAERAAAAQPGFAVDDGNAADVVAVCRALDGLPLAIELAAARARALPPAEIARRLDDRFALLGRGNRAAPAKQQTLRAVAAWSWGLLDEAEQRLARRFAAFSGGADLAAVSAVCDPGGEVADTLTGLVEKSFVEAVDGGRRYRMLATIREFAVERLVEAGEEQRVGRAHADHYRELAEAADRALLGPAQAEQLARLSEDHGNLTAALRWTVEHDAAAALRLQAALSSYWWLRGLHDEGAPLAAALLERIDAREPRRAPEDFLLCVANATADGAVVPGDRIDAAVEIAEGVAPPLRRPLLALLWPACAGQAGRSAGIGAFLERCRTAEEPWVRAAADVAEGYLRYFGGDSRRAEAAFTSGLAGFRAAGDRWGAVQALSGLAGIASWQGDLERTTALTGEALEITQRLGAREDSADLVRLRAEALLHNGDPAAARPEFEQAAELARQSAAAEILAAARYGLAEAYRQQGDRIAARRMCEWARQAAPPGGPGAAAVRAQRGLVELGRLAAAEGDSAQARSWYRRAFAGDPSRWYPPQRTLAADVLAQAALEDGNAERAARLLGASAALRGGSAAHTLDAARTAEAARARLGEAAYAAAYRHGSRMSPPQALTEIAKALSDHVT